MSVMPRIPKIYEPFVGEFTGVLSTFTASDGKRYVFAKPLPRITKGLRYMMKIEGIRITLLPLLLEG